MRSPTRTYNRSARNKGGASVERPIFRLGMVLSPRLSTGLTLRSGIGVQPSRDVGRLHGPPNHALR